MPQILKHGKNTACSYFANVITGAAARELYRCRAENDAGDIKIICPGHDASIHFAGIGFINRNGPWSLNRRWSCDEIQNRPTCLLSNNTKHKVILEQCNDDQRNIFSSSQCLSFTVEQPHLAGIGRK